MSEAQDCQSSLSGRTPLGRKTSVNSKLLIRWPTINNIFCRIPKAHQTVGSPSQAVALFRE